LCQKVLLVDCLLFRGAYARIPLIEAEYPLLIKPLVDVFDSVTVLEPTLFSLRVWRCVKKAGDHAP
jgi:hypothetical protein